MIEQLLNSNLVRDARRLVLPQEAVNLLEEWEKFMITFLSLLMQVNALFQAILPWDSQWEAGPPGSLAGEFKSSITWQGSTGEYDGYCRDWTKIAESVAAFFREEHNLQVIDKLKAAGVNMIEEGQPVMEYLQVKSLY